MSEKDIILITIVVIKILVQLAICVVRTIMKKVIIIIVMAIMAIEEQQRHNNVRPHMH